MRYWCRNNKSPAGHLEMRPLYTIGEYELYPYSQIAKQILNYFQLLRLWNHVGSTSPSIEGKATWVHFAIQKPQKSSKYMPLIFLILVFILQVLLTALSFFLSSLILLLFLVQQTTPSWRIRRRCSFVFSCLIMRGTLLVGICRVLQLVALNSSKNN